MPKPPPAVLPSSEPDVALLDKLAAFERFSLAMVITIAVANIAAWLIPFLGSTFADTWHLMPFEAALLALFCALSLRLSKPRSSKIMRRSGMVLAVLVTLRSIAVLAGAAAHMPVVIDALPTIHSEIHPLIPSGMSPQSAGGFALLGLTILLIPARKRLSIFADVVTVAMVLLVLILASGHLIAVWHMFGPEERVNTSFQSIVCLLLLAQAAVFRRADHGVFSIFLGRGMGSKIARLFSPLLLVLPYVREAGRARFIDSGRMPPHYTTAILASINVLVALSMLLFLSWRINHLEAEVSELSLRDGLTGLYNIRGFRILAEQALRMAYRSGQPFSVLFIDLDDLKQINDLLGHQTGSSFLIETGEILTDTFRETDVMGRIGGDEFAVAGQFTQAAIALAAKRLEDSAEERNIEAGRKHGLRLSIGYITTESEHHATLDELLAKADEAMYEEKRRRKVLAV